jgi:hypothetical protein
MALRHRPVIAAVAGIVAVPPSIRASRSAPMRRSRRPKTRLIVPGMGAVTFGIRLSVLAVVHHSVLPRLRARCAALRHARRARRHHPAFAVFLRRRRRRVSMLHPATSASSRR